MEITNKRRLSIASRPIPSVLTLERPRLKKTKSEESIVTDFDESERLVDNSDDEITISDSTTSTKPRSWSNLALIIVAIFGIGFTAGQILPSLLDLKKDSRAIEYDALLPSISDSRENDKETQPLMEFDEYLSDDQTGPTDSLMAIPVKSMSHSLLNTYLVSNLSLTEQATMLPSPNLTESDILALYSKKSYEKLQKKLKSGGSFRICINGGSSSAGGGNVGYNDRFFVKFAEVMELKHGGLVTEIVNRAHGDRNSMHSAMLGEAFFVPNVDLIIWEFSINDERDGPIEARNELLLWLHKLIDMYDDSPPLVLLVYLWNKPFSSDKDGKILSDVYHRHDRFAAEYDFVLGHVNLAAYLDSFEWSMDNLARYFLGDAIHPNALSHAAISNLMVDFVEGGLEPIEYDIEQETEFEWICGEDMVEQWRILDLFKGDLGGMPKAGFTAEVPRTTDPILPGMLIPHKEFLDGSVDYDHYGFRTQRYGLAKPGRLDRHRGVALPCCKDGRMVFDLVEYAPLSAIQVHLHESEGVDGGTLGHRHLSVLPQSVAAFDNVEILINDHDYTGRITFADDWNCLLSKDLFSKWILLDDKDKTFSDRISFCSRDPFCNDNIHTLEHLVIF